MEKLPEHIKELADACSDTEVQVIEAVLSGDYPNNTQAYLSVFPNIDVDSARSSVSRMLARDNVSALLQAYKDQRLLDSIMSREEAMSILSDMARVNMGDLVTFGSFQVGEDENGQPVVQSTWKFKDSESMSKAHLRSIMEINSTPQGLKIKQHDQKAAIKQLADMMGWEAPKKVDHSGGIGITGIEVQIIDPDKD